MPKFASFQQLFKSTGLKGKLEKWSSHLIELLIHNPMMAPNSVFCTFIFCDSHILGSALFWTEWVIRFRGGLSGTSFFV